MGAEKDVTKAVAQKIKKKTSLKYPQIQNLTPDRGRLLMQMGRKVAPDSETGILEVLMHEVFEML